ncbi:MAG: antitoxin [Microbacterium sp.]
MRTTLDIDDVVLRAARALAAQRTVSLGAAVSELALRGLRPTASTETVSGFPVRVPRNPAHVITDDLVAAQRDE